MTEVAPATSTDSDGEAPVQTCPTMDFIVRVSRRIMKSRLFHDSMPTFVSEWGRAKTDGTATVPMNVLVERTVQRLNMMHEKYRQFEARITNDKNRARTRVPDMEKTQAMINKLATSRDTATTMKTHVAISDGVYAEADVPPTENVALWLGAGVMVEYPIAEALGIIGSQLKDANAHIESCNSQLSMVRDQITQTEVNIARVYNWGVQQRKLQELEKEQKK